MAAMMENLKVLLKKYWIIAFFVILLILVTVTTPVFWSKYNLIGFLNLMLPFLCISIGISIVMLVGEIDLSIGSNMALASILVMTMFYGHYFLWIPEAGAQTQLTTAWSPVMPPFFIIACILLLGFLIGSVIGFLHSYIGIQGFAASLVMLYLIRGLAMCMTGGIPYHGDLGAGPLEKLTGNIGPVPVVVLLLIAVSLLFYGFLKYVPLGRSIYAAGGNPVTAELVGINVKRVKVLAYGISALLAVFAGLWSTGYFGVGDARSFQGYELYAIGMAVLGGTTFRGGHGGVINAVGGTLVFSLLITWVDLLGISYYTQTMILGFLILFVLGLNRFTAQ
ncbi:MAG: ABC transporter permease [Desulfobacterales bacterium]|nr:MAG: ABC transporter permease [Desulfobacterales bacterium]